MKHIQASILYLAFCFAFILPFSTKLGNVALGLFLITSTIFHLYKKPKINKLDFSLLKISTLLLLLSLLMSLFQFENITLTINIIAKRITYLLCPIIIVFYSKNVILKIKNYSFIGLYYGVFFSSILMIINILIKYYKTNSFLSINSDLFNYYHTHVFFTKILDVHPTYFGMFLILSLIVILFTKTKLTKTKKIIFISLSFITILFLNSRVILLIYFIIITFYLYKLIFQKTKSYLISISIVLLGLTISLLICYNLLKNTYTFQRVVKQAGWELTYGINSNYNNVGKGDSRMARWYAATEVIKENPILGYGVGNEIKALMPKYLSMGMINSESSKYNSHNQFLGFAIEGGVISLLSFIVFLLGNLYLSFKRKNLSYFFFFSSLLIVCLIENYLIRNSGIIFIAFFSSLFLFGDVKNQLPKK